MIANARQMNLNGSEPSRMSSDEDALLTEDRSSPVSSHRHRFIIGFFGIFALVGCGAFAVASMKPKKTKGGATVRALFESPEVHDIAAENIVVSSQRVLGHSSDKKKVRTIVANTFAAAGRHLHNTATSFAETQIPEQQREALLHSMRYLSDPRVQNIGLKVAKAVRESGSQNPEVVKHNIARKLGAHLQDLEQLTREVFPAPLSEAVAGGGFEHLLQPDRIRLMGTVGDSWDSRLKVPGGDRVARRLQEPTAVPGGWGQPAAATNVWGQQPAGSGLPTTVAPGLIKAEEGVGIAGAAASEALVMLRIIKPLAKLFNNDLNINPWVTSGIGAGAAALEIVSCELNAMVDGGNPEEMVACPMEFGSECFDAMREVMTLTGLLGDNNPNNGYQGNHNNNGTVHEGIFNDEKGPLKPVEDLFSEK